MPADTASPSPTTCTVVGVARKGAIPRAAKLVGQWAALGDASQATRCYIHGDTLWVRQDRLGVVQVGGPGADIVVYPDPGVASEQMEAIVLDDLLPAIYSHWGWQTLHASGAVLVNAHSAIALCGVSGAGKSTLGFGMGLRRGWHQFADDAVSFSIDEAGARVVPIVNRIRLRPASARYFGVSERRGREPLPVPEGVLLRAVFILERIESREIGFERLHGTDYLNRLLEHAFVLTTSIPEHTRDLIQAYTSLCRSCAGYLLRYPRHFDKLPVILSEIERLAAPSVSVEAGPLPDSAHHN